MDHFASPGTTIGSTQAPKTTGPVSIPRQWQFRYEPLFLPEVNAAGIPEIGIKNLIRRWLVEMAIALYTDETAQRAHQTVQGAYPPDQAKDILPSNVLALNVSRISLSIPDLKILSPNAELSREIPLSVTRDKFALQIFVRTEEEATELKSILPSLRVLYEISFAARTVAANTIKITRSDVRKSLLYTSLNGLGSSSVYVHRDDVRRLADGFSTNISVSATIENPKDFDQKFAETVLTEFGQSMKASAETFDQAKWKSTYNGDDLRPDEITKSLNKMYTKDENEEQWKYNGKLDISGKASFIDVLDAESTIGAMYSQEGLRKKLEERNVEASFEGNKIVAKSLLVSQFNISDFEGNAEFTSIQAFLSDLRTPKSGSIDIGLAAKSDASFLSLAGKIEELETVSAAHAPPGTIMGYGGSLAPPYSAPTGWLPCDGREVLKSEYPALYHAVGDIFGKPSSEETLKLPLLNGRTLVGAGDYQDATLGATRRVVGEIFGSAAYHLSHEQIPPHVHTVSGNTGGRELTGFAAVRQLSNTDGEGHVHTVNIQSGIAIAAGQALQPYAMTPPSAVVNFLIKF